MLYKIYREYSAIGVCRRPLWVPHDGCGDAIGQLCLTLNYTKSWCLAFCVWSVCLSAC